MITIQNAPYRCKMFWYACNWDEKRTDVFDTKAEAVKFAKDWAKLHPNDYVNVDFIENSLGQITSPYSLDQHVWKGLPTTYHGTKLKGFGQ